jgi:putative ABC transport system permease protein
MNDLKFAWRQLLKHPGFSCVAILTLALGIGANTTVFSVAKTVLWRPLGFVEEDGLVWIRQVNTQKDDMESEVSWREMEDLREAVPSLAAVATYGSGRIIWDHDERMESVPVLSVTPELPEVLGIRPVLGRLFVPADSIKGAPRVAMISHELWQRRYDGKLEVLGQTVQLDGKERTIVGVLPPKLDFPLRRAPESGTGSLVQSGLQSFWLPFGIPGQQDRTSRGARMFVPVGRIRSDASLEAANAEVAVLSKRLAADHPDTNRHRSFRLVTFRDQILGRTRLAMPVLAAAVAAVLLICCVNLANLLLARGVTRQREMAVRMALGAGRRRMIQALLLESTLLAWWGGLLGLALAHGVIRILRLFAEASIPFIGETALDGSAILFSTGLSLVTALAFGFLPAWRQASVPAMDSMRTGARSGAGPQIRRWQRGLLAGQIAIVLVLLTTSALLIESFRRLVGQDLGYRPESVVAVDLETWDFPSNGSHCRFFRGLRDRLAALPGVQAVGTISSVPLKGQWTFEEKVQVVGQPLPKADQPTLSGTFVGFDYFQAMGTPLVDGRFFRDSEMKDDGYGQTVLINEAAAKLLFPGRSAVGGQFTAASNPDRVLEVVGVVKDVRDVRLEARPQPRLYWQYVFGGAQILVRSSVPTRALIPILRDTLQEAGGRHVLRQQLQTMTEIVTGTVVERRFLMTMLTAYAGMALVIAALGIFGVVAYQVAERTNEFGVRLALGSTRAGLMWLVLTQAGRTVLAGLVLGLVTSLAATRLLQNQLYEISPHDPVVLALASLVLVGLALLASILPARRAAKVDPMVALRHE